MTSPQPPFGREVIESLIPHRPPFLLVDEILELEPGKRVVGRREIRADDWWFPGHFPAGPVMPGVLTIEAIAQAGAVAVLAHEANAGQDPVLRRHRRLPFQAGRRAGGRAHARVRVRARARADREGQGRALVGDELAAEAMLTVFVGE